MSTIRKQSIISSLVIYIGFAIGLVNTYFFTKQHLFSEAQYGLTGIFVAIATMMMAFASLGMPAYIAKFYPYYHDQLEPRKNDMLAWALLISSIGFVLVIVTGIVLKHTIIRKFSQNSELLVQYYHWTFVLGFGLTIYSVIEVYAWHLQKGVLTNFLREVQFRMFTTVLILLLLVGVIPNFDIFIKLYSFTFPAVAVILFLYLLFTKKIHFTFKVSKVSRRYFKKIVTLCTFVYSSLIIFTISQVFDSIVIASLNGLDKAGIYALAQLMGSVIQAPQRGIISAATSHISRAWKEKNRPLLQRIYQRSSINLLLFASGIFALIALNYREAILTFHLKNSYLLGFDAFILLGLTRVVDMGTGLNSQIIATSTYWRFELISGVLLLVFMLPLTYFLTKELGILGPAIANLVSISIYNLVRLIFLWKKFKLFPFTIQSAYVVMLAIASYAACYFLFVNIHGFAGLVIRSIAFIALYGGISFWLKISPDVIPVLHTIRKRLSGNRS